MNPIASADDHLYQVNDADVKLLAVDPASFGDRAETLREKADQPLQIMGLGPLGAHVDLLAAMSQQTPQKLRSLGRSDDECVLVYTGGTTGKPKGVLHTHRVQVAMILMQMADFDWPQESRFLAMTPITHASGALMMPVLLRSGTVIMHPGFEVKHFCHLVQTHRVTCTFMVPTMIYVLLDSPVRETHDLSSLETIMYGAAPCHPRA